MLGTLHADAGQPGWSPAEKRVGQLTDPLPRQRIGQMWLGTGSELPVRSVKWLLVAVAAAVAAARFVHVLAGRPWPAVAAVAVVVAVAAAAVVVAVAAAAVGATVVGATVVGATAAGPCWSG